MNVALLLALLIPTQVASKEKTIGNARLLIDKDWSDKHYVMSLTESTRWDSGAAWFMRFDEGGLQAWKGTYKFYLPNNETDDAILLKIGFTRHYIVIADHGQEKWQIDRRYEPKGMLLEIALEDSTVPDDDLTVSVLEGFFVDDQGVETVKRNAPQGFLQKLSGRGDARRLRELDCVNIGETLRLRTDQNFYELTRIADFLPPSFKARTVETAVKTTTTYRPASPTKSKADELFAAIQKAADKEDFKGVLNLTEQLIGIEPDRVFAYSYRGWAYRELKQYDDAIRMYDKALELKPGIAFLHMKRGRVYKDRGWYRQAAADYKTALTLAPKDPYYLNNFAWFLATCPDKTFRDGKTAVTYASQACELTTDKGFAYEDTLAAAYAETGDFAKAVELQTKALKLATESYRTELEQRLALYQRGKPFRE